MSELTGIVRYRASAQTTIANIWDSDNLEIAVRNTLQSNGWGVNHVSISGRWFSDVIDIIIDIVYICAYGTTAEVIQIAILNSLYSIPNLMNVDVQFDNWIESCTAVNTNPPINTNPVSNPPINTNPVNRVPVKPTPVRPSNNPNPVVTYTAIDITSDGYLIVKASTGQCYLYNFANNLLLDAVNCPTTSNTPKSSKDLLTQIGDFFGINKDTVGITAAAGGAIVILGILFLANRK